MSAVPVRLSTWLVFLTLAMSAVPNTLAERPPAPEKASRRSATSQTEKLEASFAQLLSGATLEGSFTTTSKAGDDAAIAKEKYTIGDVKKVANNIWMIPARIEYGDKDVTLPIVVPVRWAGDTPVVVVDNQELPGFGAVSARVLFFDDHYAGYWKHGDHGGHLFGIIRPSQEDDTKDADGSTK